MPVVCQRFVQFPGEAPPEGTQTVYVKRIAGGKKRVYVCTDNEVLNGWLAE